MSQTCEPITETNIVSIPVLRDCAAVIKANDGILREDAWASTKHAAIVFNHGLQKDDMSVVKIDNIKR